MKKYVESKFSRQFDNIDLLKEKLEKDIFLKNLKDNYLVKGEAFLAFRDGDATIYYRGRSLIYFNEKWDDYKINQRLLPITRSSNDKSNKLLSESDWNKEIQCNISFSNVSKEILDHIKIDAQPESSCVSFLYPMSAFAKGQKWILLDIEAAFSRSENDCSEYEEKDSDDRVDVVLYNVKNRQLFFIEVKRLNDNRWNSPDEINRQMKKYKELIKNEKEKIVTCYSKTIGYYNKLTCVDIPEIDLNKPILLALAITEYKKSEQDRKKRDIAKRVIDKDYVILERGSFLKVSENTIDKWAKTASEKLGFN